MAQYNFIDDIGLREILTQINNFYAAKTKLQEEIARADSVERDLGSRITSEKDRAIAAETSLAGSLRDQLSANLHAYVDQQIEDLHIEGVRSIVTVPTLPQDGGPANLVYLNEADNGLYHWSGAVWQKIDLDLRTDIEPRFTQISDDIAALQTTVNEDLADFQEEVNTVLAGLSADLSTVSADLSTESQAREALAARVTTQGEEFTQQSLDVAELQSSVMVIEAEIADIVAGAGHDQELRADFEEFKDNTEDALELANTRLNGLDTVISGFDSSISELTTSLSSHARNKENPHQVTAAQLNLGNVDNTHDLDKPISNATLAALNERVKTADVINTLDSMDATKPLSAQQGTRLVGLIQDAQTDMETRITALGNVFHFKGTVPSVAALQQVEDPVPGDCWQINNPENAEDPDNGSMYAYKETIQIPAPEPEPEEPEVDPENPDPENPETPETDPENPEVDPEEPEEPEMIDYLVWIQIVASVVDISSYAATMNEIYQIIDSYQAE